MLACSSGEPGQQGSFGAQLPSLAGLMPQQQPASPGAEPEEASPPTAQLPDMPAMPAMPAASAAPAAPAPGLFPGMQAAAPASDGDFCAVLCDRVAACGVATKAVCLPVCGPQVARLTPDERSQAMELVEKVPCDQLTGFNGQGGQPDGRQGGENFGSDDGDGDGRGEQDTEGNDAE